MNLNKNVVRLNHMLEAAEKILQFISSRERKDLDKDEMFLLAILKLIEIIGEAASKISFEIKKQNPDVPWQAIINVRNRLIHGYFDINHDILWGIATTDIPPLIENLKRIINSNEIK